MMEIRDEISKQCVLLKSVSETIRQDDIRISLFEVGEHGIRFQKYVEEANDDIRWIVQLQSEKAAVKCIEGETLTVKTIEDEVFNVLVSYCPECIIPSDWIEEESDKLNHQYSKSLHNSKMESQISDTQDENFITSLHSFSKMDQVTDSEGDHDKGDNSWQENSQTDTEKKIVHPLTENNTEEDTEDIKHFHDTDKGDNSLKHDVGEEHLQEISGFECENFITSIYSSSSLEKDADTNDTVDLEIISGQKSETGSLEHNDKDGIVCGSVSVTENVIYGDENNVTGSDTETSQLPDKTEQDKCVPCYRISPVDFKSGLSSDAGNTSSAVSMPVESTVEKSQTEDVEVKIKCMPLNAEGEDCNGLNIDQNRHSSGPVIGSSIPHIDQGVEKMECSTDMHKKMVIPGNFVKQQIDTEKQKDVLVGKTEKCSKMYPSDKGNIASQDTEGIVDVSLQNSDRKHSSSDDQSDADVYANVPSKQREDNSVQPPLPPKTYKSQLSKVEKGESSVNMNIVADLKTENLTDAGDSTYKEKSHQEERFIKQGAQSGREHLQMPYQSNFQQPPTTPNLQHPMPQAPNWHYPMSPQSPMTWITPQVMTGQIPYHHQFWHGQPLANITTNQQPSPQTSWNTGGHPTTPVPAGWQGYLPQVPLLQQNMNYSNPGNIQMPYHLNPTQPHYGYFYGYPTTSVPPESPQNSHQLLSAPLSQKPDSAVSNLDLQNAQPVQKSDDVPVSPVVQQNQQTMSSATKVSTSNKSKVENQSKPESDDEVQSESSSNEDFSHQNNKPDVRPKTYRSSTSNSDKRKSKNENKLKEGWSESSSDEEFIEKNYERDVRPKTYKHASSYVNECKPRSRDKLQKEVDEQSESSTDEEIRKPDVRPKTFKTSSSSSYSESDDYEPDICFAIIVKMSGDLPEDTLVYYFENTRRSGGGEIKEIEYCPITKKAYIEFSDHKAVDRIIEKGTEHKVSEVTIFIRICPPGSPRVMDDYKIMITGMNPSTSQDCLFNFLEVTTGMIPTDILYGEDPGQVLVMFDEKPDLEELQKICKKKPLDGHKLEITKVALSDSVRVSDLDKHIGRDDLLYYFENTKKSGGDTVVDLDLHQRKGICIISFECNDVVSRVCSRRHRIHNRELEVSEYHACLGLMGGTEEQISLELPNPIIKSGIDSNVIRFLKTSEAYKTSFENELQRHHAKIEWPLYRDSDTLRFVCVMNLNDRKASQVIQSWSENVESVIGHFLDVIQTKYHPVAGEVWKIVVKCLRDINIKHPDGVSVILTETDNTIVVVGHKRIVKELSRDIEEMISREEMKLKQKQDKVTKTERMKLYQLQLLRRTRFIDQVKEDIDIQIDMDQKHIKFYGNPEKIQKAKMKMFETLDRFVSKKMPSSSRMKQMLSKRKVCDMINQEMKAKGIMGIWDLNVDSCDLEMFAKDYNQVDAAIETLKTNLVEKSIPMNELLEKFLKTSRWQKTVQSLEAVQQDLACVEAKKGSIIVTGLKNVFDSVYEKIRREVKDYTEINSIVNENVKLDEGTVQFLEKYRSSDLRDIERPLIPRYQISILVHSGPSKFGLSIKGHKDGVRLAQKSLDKLINNVQTEKFVIAEKGAREYFLSSKGHDCIRQTEIMSHCIIKVTGKQQKHKKHISKRKEHHQRGDNMQNEKEPVLRAKCQHYKGRYINVMEGDMTKLRVDAIVNAANQDMDHCGGIALAIAEAGGRTIQSECTEYVKKHGPVPDGSAICSGPGKLPCKMVIHTVGPVWKDGNQKEEYLLKRAIISSLSLASEKSLKSVAFPAISAGIFGYPLDLSTRHIVEAIKDYLSNEWKNSTLTDVYLCDVDSKTISSFIHSLMKEYDEDDVEKIENSGQPTFKREKSYSCSESDISSEEERDAGSDSESDSDDYVVDNDRAAAPQRSGPSDHGFKNTSDRSDGSSKSASRNVVKIVKGELAHHKAEVIVNSTQPDLNLSAGILSKSLLQESGDEMQSECRKKYPNGIKYGEIAVTKGGNLSCNFVYHGTVMRWDGGKGPALQNLERFIVSCLSLAGSKNVSSIALPALGTGKLGYPADVVAKVMFGCIHGYLKKNGSSSLKSIEIVIYPKDVATYRAFESFENGEHPDQQHSGAIKYPYSRSDDTQSKISYPHHTGRGDHSSQAQSHISGSHNPVHKAKLGHLMVTIVIGDITKETSHVVVNSTMEGIDLSKGAVSRAILKAAGTKIQEECYQKASKLTSDKLVVSSGGNMSCKVIFHVKSQKDADEWERVVAKCLYEADTRQFVSISFPALGTGGQGCSPDDVAKAMFKAMRKFSSPDPHYLKYVRIVVFQKTMIDRFVSVLGQKEPEGYISKIKDTAGKIVNTVSETVEKGIKNLTGEEDKGTSQNKGHHRKGVKNHAEKQDGVTFLLYSDSRDNIKKAKKKLEETHENQFCVEQTAQKYDNIVKNLSDHQISKLEGLCKNYHVTVKVDKHRGQVELKGQQNNVNKSMLEVTEYLREVEKKKEESEKAKQFTNYVQWFYEDNKKMKSFHPEMNYQIETAYKNKQKFCQVKDGKSVKYTVDFHKMEEYVVSQPGVKFRVERREPSSHGDKYKLPIPRTWSQMKSDEILKIVPLHPGNREYEKVKSEFIKSAHASKSIIQTVGRLFRSPSAPTKITEVIGIERIQNKSLYQQYAAKRSELYVKNKNKTPERWLWHGTSPDTLTKINNNGFNRSYCGKNGTAYGQGVYFAVNASYSLGYCQADSKGYCHMYSVQVLTGESCQGNGSMRVLPPKGTSSHVTYDSASDNTSNPQMFVIFHDSQAYPTYHISFK